jgi:hypothetical protein
MSAIRLTSFGSLPPLRDEATTVLDRPLPVGRVDVGSLGWTSDDLFGLRSARKASDQLPTTVPLQPDGLSLAAARPPLGATTTAAGQLRTKPPRSVRPGQAEARWRQRVSSR